MRAALLAMTRKGSTIYLLLEQCSRLAGEGVDTQSEEGERSEEERCEDGATPAERTNDEKHGHNEPGHLSAELISNTFGIWLRVTKLTR